MIFEEKSADYRTGWHSGLKRADLMPDELMKVSDDFISGYTDSLEFIHNSCEILLTRVVTSRKAL